MNEENQTGTALLENAQEKPDNTGKRAPVPQGNGKPNNGKAKKGKSVTRRVIAIIVVVALLAGAAILIIPMVTKKSTTAVSLTEAKVTRGNISKTISGSGVVQPVQEYTVVPTVTGQILVDKITQGQKINKGDLLYGIDPTNANNAIQQAQNALERAQLTYNQSAQSVGYLNVTSDISGVITKVYVKNGDQVNANAPIMDVQDSSNLILTIPFNAADAANIYNGESAQVTLEATGTVLSGTVTKIYSGQQIGSGGSLVTNIDITLQNPGVIQSGATATAVVGGQFACNTAGTIAYVAQKTVTAKTSGQVTGLTLQAGDSVRAGTTVATLSNDSTTSSAQSAELQVENAQLQLQNAQNALNNYNLTSPISGTVIEKDMKAGDTISNTSSTNTMAVIADMTSLVLTINVDELDILNVKTGQTANITADAVPNKTFTGTVTNISTIGNTGSTSSSSSGTGVTTYAVQITITDYGTLLPGMNVNSSIVTDSASNVLLIPEQAVMSGGFVLRKISDTAAVSGSPAASATPQAGGSSHNGSGQYGKGGTGSTAAGASAGTASAGHNGSGQYGNSGTAAGNNTGGSASGSSPSGGTPASPAASGGSGSGNSNNANRMKQLQAAIPKGYELVRVQIGLTDGTYAEVTSGLNEGDTIGYVVPTTSSSSTSSSNRTGFGFGGGGTTVVRASNGGGGYPGGGGNFSGGGNGSANRPSGSSGSSYVRGG